MTDADDNAGRWVSLADAARLANVSERTMRRRIHAQEVTAELREGKWFVAADSAQAPASGTSMVPMVILERLDQLRAELMASEVARARAETVAEFQTQRATTEAERRQALEAEVERLRLELEERDKAPTPEPPTPRPRWWQRGR